MHFLLKTNILLAQQICHRDLKLENTLLDGSPAPRLKICDFGYSKARDHLLIWKPMPSCLNWSLTVHLVLQSSVLHSQPKSTVGTPAYIAPEVLSRKEYDGKVIFVSFFSQNGKEREQKKLWGLVLMSKINGQCFYLFHHYRLQMFGLVGLPYMWCLLVLIHLKILMIQEISGKQLRLVIYGTGFKLPNSFLLHLWFLSSWDVDCLWQRILSVHYSIPDYVRVSMECKHLLSRIFVANPEKVIN